MSSLLEDRNLSSQIVSLPPGVKGQTRCYLCLRVSSITWTRRWKSKCEVPTRDACVRVCWHGETDGVILFPPNPCRKYSTYPLNSSVKYQVCCGPKQFRTYLQDCGILKLHILSSPVRGIIIGEVAIREIKSLSSDTPINGFFSIIQPSGDKCGNLYLSITLENLFLADMPTPDFNHSIEAVGHGQQFLEKSESKFEKTVPMSSQCANDSEETISFLLNKVRFLQKVINIPTVETFSLTLNKDEWNEFTANSELNNSQMFLDLSNVIPNKMESSSLKPIEDVLSCLLDCDGTLNDVPSALQDEDIIDKINCFTEFFYDAYTGNHQSSCHNNSNSPSQIISSDMNEPVDIANSLKQVSFPQSQVLDSVSSVTETVNVYDTLSPEKKLALQHTKFMKIKLSSLKINGSCIPMSLFSQIEKHKFLTFIVIVKFPFASGRVTWDSKGHRMSAQELVFVSKKIKNGAVIFDQDIVIPCEICRNQYILNKDICFIVKTRIHDLRKVITLGTGNIQLETIVNSDSFSLNCQLSLQCDEFSQLTIRNYIPSSLSLDSFSYLQVHISLVGTEKANHMNQEAEKQKDGHTVKLLEDSPACQTINENSYSTLLHRNMMHNEDKLDLQTAKEEKSALYKSCDLFCLFEVSKGKGFCLSAKLKKLRLNCRLFSSEIVIFNIYCNQIDQPVFDYIQVFPIKKNIIEEFNKKIMIVEVWEVQEDEKDSLLGLCKVPLNHFHTLQDDVDNFDYECKHPKIAVNNFVPVVHPILEDHNGDLHILLALGTWKQISELMDRVKSVAFPNENFVIPDLNNTQAKFSERNVSRVLNIAPQLIQQSNNEIHLFQVVIEKIETLLEDKLVSQSRDLCSVEYYFPVQELVNGDFKIGQFESETSEVLSTVNFNHTNNHYLFITNTQDLETEIQKAFLHQSELTVGMLPIKLWLVQHFNRQKYVVAETNLPSVCLYNMMKKRQNDQPLIQNYVLQLVHKNETSKGNSKNYGHMYISIIYQQIFSTFSQNLENIGTCDKEGTQKLEQLQKEKDMPVTDGKLKKQTDRKISEKHSITSLSEDSGFSSSFLKSPKPGYKLHIIIERALHMFLKVGSDKNIPFTYATVHANNNKLALTESNIEHDKNPVWNHHANLDLPRECKLELIVKVWETTNNRQDKILGYACIDLAALSKGLKYVSGWYNLSNSLGECCGQIKISAVPLDIDRVMKCSVQKNFKKRKSSIGENDNVCEYNNVINDGMFRHGSGTNFQMHNSFCTPVNFYGSVENKASPSGNSSDSEDKSPTSGFANVLKKQLADLDSLNIKFHQRLSVSPTVVDNSVQNYSNTSTPKFPKQSKKKSRYEDKSPSTSSIKHEEKLCVKEQGGGDQTLSNASLQDDDTSKGVGESACNSINQHGSGDQISFKLSNPISLTSESDAEKKLNSLEESPVNNSLKFTKGSSVTESCELLEQTSDNSCVEIDTGKNSSIIQTDKSSVKDGAENV